jgi:hypothetical protein
MSLPTVEVNAEAAATIAPGAYVPAELAQALEQTLDKLSWQVLYGKAIDASSLAISAEQLLSQMRAAANNASLAKAA